MDCHKNWKATSSGGELTASQTASTNSTAKGLIYVFQNRRSSSAAAYAFNRLSSGQFDSNRRQTREKRSSGSTLWLSRPPCRVSVIKCLVDATKSRQTAIVALCIFDEPLRLNQLKQHRKNEYGGAPTVAEQHPTVISRRLIAISPLTPPTATTDNSTLSAHCGPQNKNLGVNIKIWFFCPEVIQYPKKTLLGSNWCAESNGNTCRCVAVTVLEKKGDLVWYSAHSAPQIINSGAK